MVATPERFCCRICVDLRGYPVPELDLIYKSAEECREHVAAVHHVLLRVPGEDPAEVERQFLLKHPEAITCPDCIKRGAPWCRKVG